MATNTGRLFNTNSTRINLPTPTAISSSEELKLMAEQQPKQSQFGYGMRQSKYDDTMVNGAFPVIEHGFEAVEHHEPGSTFPGLFPAELAVDIVTAPLRAYGEIYDNYQTRKNNRKLNKQIEKVEAENKALDAYNEARKPYTDIIIKENNMFQTQQENHKKAMDFADKVGRNVFAAAKYDSLKNIKNPKDKVMTALEGMMLTNDEDLYYAFKDEMENAIDKVPHTKTNESFFEQYHNLIDEYFGYKVPRGA